MARTCSQGEYLAQDRVRRPPMPNPTVLDRALSVATGGMATESARVVCTPDQQQPRVFAVATDLFPHPYKAMITSARHGALQQKHMFAETYR